jgi:hypothetical protein
MVRLFIEIYIVNKYQQRNTKKKRTHKKAKNSIKYLLDKICDINLNIIIILLFFSFLITKLNKRLALYYIQILYIGFGFIINKQTPRMYTDTDTNPLVHSHYLNSFLITKKHDI